MFLLLLCMGVAAAIIGLAAAAVGFQVYADLGNTLIVSGALVMAAGLVIVALAALVRHLAQLGEIMLQARAAPADMMTGESADFAPAPPRPMATRMPLPMPPLPAASRDEYADPRAAERAPERRYDPAFDRTPPLSDRDADAMMQPAPPPLEQPMMEEAETVPLSPSPPPRTAAPLPSLRPERRIPREDMPRPVTPMSMRALRGETPPDVEAAPLEGGPRTILDALFPDEAKKRRSLDTERPAPPVNAPPVAAAPPSAPMPEVQPDAAREAQKGRGAKPTVLKSGVIEGMAYTLYTDGSIEAQMAEGTIRFSSIEELRAHLETTDPA